MINRKRRLISGILSGALGVTVVAQEPAAPTEPVKPAEPAEPAKPAEDLFKAPDNVAAAPAEASKTESGLASLILKKGTGNEKPAATDTVRVHYTGWQASDGTMFDSSVKRGQPSEFALNGVIKGWTEGLQLMVVGEKRRFWIPSALAYGDQGRVAGNLTFDVELLEIVKPPSAPKELIAPADAVATESGLKFKVLKAGEGDPSPAAEDVVTCQFTGWKADGEFLMTSTRNPQPAQLPLNQIPIKGLTEGVQLMKKGEKRRFWIPASLAYGKVGEAPEGAPAGDLIFDFELISFQPVPKPPPPPKDPNAPKDVAAAPEGATQTESGISYTVIKAGEGDASPADTDLLKVSFKGWDANGASIGSSETMGGPMALSLDKAPIKGWVEILKTMKKGESRRVWIPENLTFEVKQPGAPEGALTFDLVLVDFNAKPEAPKTPEDVAAPPADAKKTESGISYKVLKAGTGKRRPIATDTVEVHYAGWMTDGKMFDNSIERDERAKFPLNGVIKGWTEGVQLMVEGEKTRFWIPAELAYGDTPSRPGGPSGMLVFDIELFTIVTPEAPKKIEAVTPPIEVKPIKPKEEK
ncbi:MAG: FKBP-type peptidyl-prolyl cis-trans isomerase [Akkermansiaceae bacterium]